MFQEHLDIVFFIYGLSFVAMGLSVAFQPRRNSTFGLSRILWLLAGFGILHGVNEWLDMWAIIKGPGPVLGGVRWLCLMVSYLFIFEFGRRLHGLARSGERTARGVHIPGWVTPAMVVFIAAASANSGDFTGTGSILARYLFGFTGAVLSGAGFVRYYMAESERLESLGVKGYFALAGATFLAYGLLGGLVTPPGEFFPANFLNTENFLAFTGIPVEAVRSVMAVGTLVSVTGILKVFHWESHQSLKEALGEARRARDELDEKVRERTAELAEANSALAEDIEEKARAEREIRRLNEVLEKRVSERTSELRASNQELEAFSYSVAHDLRAPLRIIDGFSQALIEDYSDRLDPEGISNLERVRAASQRMARLIDDLLELSRLARKEVKREEVDLTGLAESVARSFKKVEPERDVEFRIAEGLEAECDRGLTRVMLENLLGNAWKFTSERDKAVVEFGSLREESGKEVFFVRDNGAGFDMRYASRLFGAFQRLHSPSDFQGTGIGLATVQRIVHRHGGEVRAEGELGKGATFYFTL